MTIQITSDALFEGELIPVKYTCDGDNISPPLRWTNIPPGTISLALICEDPDAPADTLVHWILYNLPPSVAELPEGASMTGILSNEPLQGRNDFQRIGYGGPCPPPNGSHRYVFRLYALDTALQLEAGADKHEFARAIEGHILASGQLMGWYKRK